MTGRSPTIAVEDRGTTIVLRGYKVPEVARHAGLRPIYSGVSRGWVTDSDKLGDLLAFCQRRRIEVSVGDHHNDVDGVHHHEVDDVLYDGGGAGRLGGDQLDLFGGEAA